MKKRDFFTGEQGKSLILNKETNMLRLGTIFLYPNPRVIHDRTGGISKSTGRGTVILKAGRIALDCNPGMWNIV